MLFVLSEGFSAMRKHIFFYPAAPVRDFAGSCISDAEGEDMPHRGVFGRLRRPGGVGAHRQGQKGQGHQGFPAPLDSPTFPLDATPFGRASKCEGTTVTSGAPRVTA